MVVGTNRERCEICGAEEVGEKMSLAAATLRTRLASLAQAPARFVIRTNPHGARVKLDGKLLGQTPVDTNLHRRPAHRGHRARGLHPARADHHRHQRRRRDAGPGSRCAFRPASRSASPAGRPSARAWPWRAEACTSCRRTATRSAAPRMRGWTRTGTAPRCYDTKLLGASLLGLSAVSITLGGMWLYMDQPGAEAPTNERAQATRRGGSPRFLLGTSGRFWSGCPAARTRRPRPRQRRRPRRLRGRRRRPRQRPRKRRRPRVDDVVRVDGDRAVAGDGIVLGVVGGDVDWPRSSPRPSTSSRTLTSATRASCRAPAPSGCGPPRCSGRSSAPSRTPSGHPRSAAA